MKQLFNVFRQLAAIFVALAAFGTFAVEPQDDWLAIDGGNQNLDVGQAVDQSVGAYFGVASGSSATLSVAGLPDGVKFDAQARRFSGAPTKRGVYYVTMSAKNANGFAHSFTEIWYVGNAETGDYDAIEEYDFSDFDSLCTGNEFAWEGSGISSISGLPDGLKFNANTGKVSGMPTKAGKFVLKFTDWRNRTAVKTIIVQDGGSSYVRVVARESINYLEFVGGTVSGSGVYACGAKVTLKATAAKGYAFQEWMDWNEDYDDRSGATKTFILPPHGGNVTIYACFIPARDDFLNVYGGDQDFDVWREVDQAEDAYFGVESGSSVTLSVSGLPAGVKFDAKTRTFSGAPTKRGVYYVTMSAKNANGFAHSFTERWCVGNAKDGDYDAIEEYDFSDFDSLCTGYDFEWVGSGLSTISGLPDGLKFSANTGMVSGMPTKAGKFVLKFTDWRNRTAVRTIIVQDGGSQYVDVIVRDVGSGATGVGGTVSGVGVYACGAKVTLTATAAKGYAFAYWQEGDVVDDDDEADIKVDRVSGTKKTVRVPAETIDACFMPARYDFLDVYGYDQSFDVWEEVDQSEDAYFGVESGSSVTLSVSGLPAGVKFDAKTRTFSGAPTKRGVYYVTMSAKNANGFAHSHTEKWNVGDVEQEDFDEWGLDLDLFDGLQTGHAFSWCFDRSLKVSGLPAGLSVKTSSVRELCMEDTSSVVGTPTKAGVYTLKFTSGKRVVAVKTVIVRESGSLFVETPVEDYDESCVHGTVTGGGVFAVGAQVKLLAAAAKGAAFVGWFRDGEIVSQGTTYSFAAGIEEPPVARFIAAKDDRLWIDGDGGRQDLCVASSGRMCTEYIYYEEEFFAVDSGSPVTLSVAGLPKGMSFSEKTRLFTGAPAKAGVYYVSLTAKNANGYVFTATQQWVVGDVSPDDYDLINPDEGWLDAFNGLSTGEEFYWQHDELASCAGLPDGLKFNAKTGEVYGTPTKPGKYTLKLGDFAKRTAKKTIIVRDNGSRYVDVCLGDGQEGCGTVKGEGVYAAGATVKLSAKASKGYAFAGWYEASDLSSPIVVPGGGDYRTANLSFSLAPWTASPMYARFVSPQEDHLSFSFEDGETWAVATDIGNDAWGFTIDSETAPTVTAKNLPAGIALRGFSFAVTDISKLKPGITDVTVTAKNLSGISDNRILRIVIPNIVSEYLPNLSPDMNAYCLTAGVSVPSDLLDFTTEEGWWVTDVSGLPKGMRLATLCGSREVYGTPTVSGTFTVTVTAENGKQKTHATVTFNVDALPAWARGDFSGLAVVSDIGGREAHGPATLSVTSDGKISGKVTVGGETWKFSGDGFNGIDGSSVYVTLPAKSGKTTRWFTLSINQAEAPAGLLNAVAEMSFAEDFFGGGSARLARNMWKDKATAVIAKGTLSDLAGRYNASLTDSDSPCGWGYLSLAVGTDGTVKSAGKLPDGTSISASSPLLYDGGYRTFVHAMPKAYKGGEVVVEPRFDGEMRGVACDGIWVNCDPAATSDYGAGFWRYISGSGARYNSKANLHDNFDPGTLFTFDLDTGRAILAYVFKYTWFDDDIGKAVAETRTEYAGPADVPRTEFVINSKGTGFVLPNATKPIWDAESGEWMYEGANDGALTLSFTPATGIFKGTYTLWYEYENAYDETTDKTMRTQTPKKVDFEGIMVPGETSLNGFYLWDATGVYEDEKTGKEKTYKYKESCSVSLRGDGWGVEEP